MNEAFHFGKELSHVIGVTYNRWRWSKSVVCYSWDKLMRIGNYTGNLVRRRISWCDSVFVSRHVSSIDVSLPVDDEVNDDGVIRWKPVRK